MIDIPGKGAFYRVVVGAFATRAEARAACAPVRAGGAYCALVRKRPMTAATRTSRSAALAA